MKKLNLRNTILIGFTLFSMFFGAGNLIFPPLLGAQAGSQTVLAMAGMLITAVCFPILAVASIAKHDNLTKLLSTIHPAVGVLFTVLVCLMIGPFVAIPRTASTSFEMAVVTFIGNSAHPQLIRTIYSALFFLAASFIALRPNKLKDLLGRIMTPLLIIMIALTFIGVFLKFPMVTAAPTAGYEHGALMTGFITGYQTMDILAALQFGIIIAMNIEDLGVTDRDAVARETIKAGVIAGIMLAVIYSATSYIGAVLSTIPGVLTETETGAGILNYAINACYGRVGQIFAGLTFFIACFDVCCGLLSACSKYFHELLPAVDYKVWLLIFAVFSFVISSAGLYSILAFSFPVLKVICPISILIIFYGFIKKKS